MVVKIVVVLCLVADMCGAVIYHLNETEYDRMPPLFKMDPQYGGCLAQRGGVYCVASFQLHGGPDNDLMHMIREYSEHELKHYNHTIIDRAVCVTKSCKKFIQNRTYEEPELTAALEGCINETIWAEFGLEATINQIIYCDKHGDQEAVGLEDWALAGILISLLAMNIIGSVYDFCYVKRGGGENHVTSNPYLLCFSIRRNWKLLSNTNIDPKFERVFGLHGIKSIATFLVILAHIMWLVGIGYTENTRDFEMSHDQLHYQVIFSGMAIVQIFFVISGCLLYFHLQVYSETKTLTWKDVPKILFLRWARLTPANGVMVLFTATWLRRLGSGPLWNMFVGGVAHDCRAHWWQHLLYFNNYVPQDKFCAVQCWHVAAELQLFTAGLAVFVATGARGRLAALATLAAAGMAAPALHVWWDDLDALVMHKPEFYRTFESATYRHMHVLTHNNLSCHALGMAVGLLSYYCVKNNIQYTNSKLMKVVTWCVPLAIVGLFVSGMMFYVDGERPSLGLRMAFAAVQRPAMGILTAILILNLVMRFENSVRGVVEWRGWVVTSRLSYGVYLLHINFIHVLLGSRTQLASVSFFYLIINHLGVASLSFAAAVPFHLLLESPLHSLTKLLVEGIPDHKQKKIN